MDQKMAGGAIGGGKERGFKNLAVLFSSHSAEDCIFERVPWLYSMRAGMPISIDTSALI